MTDMPRAADSSTDTSAGRSYRVLLAIVIGLGVLLLVGTIGLVWGLVRQAGKVAGAGRPAVVAPPTSAGPVDVVLPRGARVVESDLDGGRILLRVETDGETRLLIVDAATGALVGELVPRAE